MPQAGPAIAAWAANLTWGAVGVAALKVAAVVGLSAVASKLQAKKLHEDGRFTARDVEIQSAASPELVVYGEAWCAGVTMYANQRHTPGSTDNYEVYKAVVHAAHECEGITDLFFDNDLVTDAAHINWGSGRIDAGKYGVSKGGVWACELEKHLGTSSQTVSTLLNTAFSGDFTSDHRARGRCYTVFKFTYFSATVNAPENIFYGSIPQNIKARVKGKKVYDSRLDSTNGGSGAHRFATPSTWEWSANPILCATDYLTQYVKGVGANQIDWPWVAAQADICDASVDVPGGAQSRYACNGVISLGNTNRENLQAILSSCLGTCPKVNGKFRPTAGAYVTPDVALTDADVVGDVTMVGSPTREERFNTVRGTYYSADDFATEVDFLEITSSTYVTRDNEEVILRTISLPMTNNEYQAQRIAFKHLLQSDQMITCTIPLRWTGLALHEGAAFTFTYPPFGWTTKAFRVVEWRMGEEGAPITVVAREDASTAWADPDTDPQQYSVRDAQGVVTFGTISLDNPTGGAPGQLPYVEDFEDNNLSRVLAHYSVAIHAGGEELIVAETGTPPTVGGQYVYEIGNNSGDDEVSRVLASGRAIPIEHNILYRMTVHFRRVSGTTNNIFLGVAGLAANKINYVNTAGSDDFGSQFYVVADSYHPTGTGWETRIGHFIRTGGAASLGSGTIQTPGILHASVNYVVPIFYANNSAQAGKFQIGYIEIVRVGVVNEIVNSAVVKADGAAFTWTSDGSGAYPGGNPTHDLTVTFYRNGASIATHVVRATLTSATGNIAIASQSSAGETTTYAETGDGTQYAVATITHTESNTMAAAVFQALNVQSGGSFGK